MIIPKYELNKIGFWNFIGVDSGQYCLVTHLSAS